MQNTNYIFSGFGYSCGKYRITNTDISDAIDKGFLRGFSNDKIKNNKAYLEFVKENPDVSPFEYFAGQVMGFSERHHVTPFPPTTKKLYYAESSLELCIKAITNALQDSELQAKDVDAWFVSTVSPHEQAPGIAATVKSFFVPFSDQRPAFTLSSGCAGFNMNLETAIAYFNSHPEAKNIVIAHTETMSSFLTQRIKFVPFVTFGDASAAVVLSRVVDDEKYGIINVLNLHDLKMLEYVGVDNKRNLYMDDSLIKDRATINIIDSAAKCLKESNWTVDEIDYLVPHQTGNVILNPAAETLGVSKSKLFLEGQKKFGNISGATVPLSLSLLSEQGKLTDGLKILSATAGVGGNFGAFSYIHKNIKNKSCEFDIHRGELAGKNALILGASGHLGIAVATEMQKRGANLWLHANKNSTSLNSFKTANILQCDFTDKNSIEKFIKTIIESGIRFDYLINLSGSALPGKCMQVNFFAVAEIINKLLPQINETILNLGTASEDSGLTDADEWISSNRAFHGFLASASGEIFKNGVKTVYIQSGFCESGISKNFNEKYIFKFMLYVGQVFRLKTEQISYNVVNSLYLPKVLGLDYSYENAMLVGRMGYKLEVDI
jgi:3-oxoacyl-[acyl-carrier-protein] synthase-3